MDTPRTVPPPNSPDRWKKRTPPGMDPAAKFKKPPRPPEVERRLTEAQRNLAADYLPLARKLAKPYKALFAGLDLHEDLDSAAALAVCESARTFDPKRNICFASYTAPRIRGAMLRAGRLAIQGRAWSLVEGDEARGTVLMVDHQPASIDLRDEAERELRRLPARHAEVCRAIYLDGREQDEIAAALGCSRQMVSWLHRESLRLLGAAA